MIALGDAKGAALALMVEVLAAALVGTHFAFEASSFLDDKGGPPQTGQLIIAIDPAGFGHARFRRTHAGARAGDRIAGGRALAGRAAACTAREGAARGA